MLSVQITLMGDLCAFCNAATLIED